MNLQYLTVIHLCLYVALPVEIKEDSWRFSIEDFQVQAEIVCPLAPYPMTADSILHMAPHSMSLWARSVSGPSLCYLTCRILNRVCNGAKAICAYGNVCVPVWSKSLRVSHTCPTTIPSPTPLWYATLYHSFSTVTTDVHLYPVCMGDISKPLTGHW